ncbi:MAG: VCBS repeat-containing protein [Propionicimonas sp.]|uniref:FG-GAP repeat domain-containing protein n=1 Tax=Propionicimonas sp. TaxID=1955623 RepID=UPI003D142F8E
MVSPRNLATLIVTAALCAVPGAAADTVPATAVSASATSVSHPASVPATTATPDFDGDGKADLAWSYLGPWEDTRIHVRYGNGTTVMITAQRTILDEIGMVGNPLLAADLNDDGHSDLLFIAVGLESGTSLCALFGSDAGLPLDSLQCRTVTGLSSTRYVASLALLEQPTRRLVMGEVSSKAGASGQLAVYALGADGFPGGAPTIVRPGAGKLPKLSDAGSFGRELTASDNQLFVGAPLASVGSAKEAGAVMALGFGTSGVTTARAITQNTAGVAGTAAKGDRFGSGVAARDGYLAVGTPGDKVGTVKEAGTVQLFTLAPGTVTPAQQLSQSSPGVPGASEPRDRFGQSVAIGTVCVGVTGVIVGAPHEAVTTDGEVQGAATVIPLDAAADCAAEALYEGHGLGGKPQSGRFLGEQLAVVRDAGDSADQVVVAGEGLFSDMSPIGALGVWSAQTRKAGYYVKECVERLTGR